MGPGGMAMLTTQDSPQESARGLAQSKTLPRDYSGWVNAKRSAAALRRSGASQFIASRTRRWFQRRRRGIFVESSHHRISAPSGAALPGNVAPDGAIWREDDISTKMSRPSHASNARRSCRDNQHSTHAQLDSSSWISRGIHGRHALHDQPFVPGIFHRGNCGN